MKKNFWLILAIASLLGMIIMPGMANSAVISVPVSLPGIGATPIALPHYPTTSAAGNLPLIQIPAPVLQVLARLLPPVVTQAPAPIAAPMAVNPEAAHSAVAILHKMAETGRDKSRSAPGQAAAALFDSAAQSAPAPVQATDTDKPAAQSADSRPTLPEWDLEQELGIGH